MKIKKPPMINATPTKPAQQFVIYVSLAWLIWVSPCSPDVIQMPILSGFFFPHFVAPEIWTESFPLLYLVEV